MLFEKKIVRRKRDYFKEVEILVFKYSQKDFLILFNKETFQLVLSVI